MTENKKELLFYRWLILILSLVIVILVLTTYKNALEKTLEPAVLKNNTRIPHYEYVMNLISRLSYSGLKTLTKPNVDLEIDFKNRTWTLKNLHRLDENGQILLEEGRYGWCGQLADYVYRQLKPVFGSDYAFYFDRVTETGFFLNPKSTHYVLRIKQLSQPRVMYIVDPSLARYGRIENFENYIFFGSADKLDFKSDAVFEIPTSTPVMIKKNFIITMGVDYADDRFDKKNFVIDLSATRQYHFSGRYLFALRLRDGRVQKFENRELAHWILDRNDYEKLKTRITDWFIANTVRANPQIDKTEIEKIKTGVN